jgi:DNA-binding beta-propeller fold protein YncE
MRRRWVPLGLLLAAVVAGGTVAVRSATQGGPDGRMAVVGFGPQGVLVDARSRHVFTLDAAGLDRHGKYLPTGAVSMLDAGTGTVLRSVPVGNNPTWMAADERTGCLCVVVLGIGSANGLTVRTLDTTTGAVLHSVTLLRSSTAGPVWLGPDAIAVDAQTGHVAVARR